LPVRSVWPVCRCMVPVARPVLVGMAMRALFLALWLMSAAHAAHAGRKRVAVLSFTGPSAEKIRGEVIKLVQASHTVISLAAWQKTAKAQSATQVTTVNVKKVARKLGVDAVIEATITKGRGGFNVRLRLREGATGETLENMLIKTAGPRFGKAAQYDLEDDVFDVIASLGNSDDSSARRKSSR
jgi:hypothetical protein